MTEECWVSLCNETLGTEASYAREITEEDFQKLFEEVNVAGDGNITCEELLEAFGDKLLPKHLHTKSVSQKENFFHALIQNFDQNWDGMLQYTEFKAFAKTHKVLE